MTDSKREIIAKVRQALRPSRVCDVEWLNGELVPVVPKDNKVNDQSEGYTAGVHDSLRLIAGLPTNSFNAALQDTDDTTILIGLAEMHGQETAFRAVEKLYNTRSSKEHKDE